jgi:LPS O-antigen subunit length determinant protein (WzzB/FepE family)
VNSSKPVHTDGDYEFDMVSLCRVAWANKPLIAASTIVAALIALVFALVAVPIFRAEVVVTIVEDDHMGGGLQSFASQFGGLASMAGVNLGTGGPEREYRAVLESWHLVEEFVNRNGVLPLLQGDAKQPPRLWGTVGKFKKSVLRIDDDKVKGTTTVSMNWTDPVIAARWANAFVALANELVRTKARDESSRNIDYLNKQVAQTNVVELQRVMYNLIESETKTLMLANARAEYAYKVVDPAVVPEMRISPKRTLIVLSGLVIGLIVGVLAAWVRNKFAAHRDVADASLP